MASVRPEPRHKSSLYGFGFTRTEVENGCFGFGSLPRLKTTPFLSRPNMPRF